MKILAIETSCDETAISIIEAKGGFEKPQFKVIADVVISQIDIHKQYGGVFPALAKREHTKNLLPVLINALEQAKMLTPVSKGSKISNSQFLISKRKKIEKILERESEMIGSFLEFTENHKTPKIDAIAVTQGPGLAPALWTGINFAKALSLVWDKPLIPTNHMEGHIFASLLKKEKVQFPTLALLLSGGHTELVLMKDWTKFKTIGQTRDDAVGEAYDKVARMLKLPYPGGPEVSKLADECKKETGNYKLPRPMLHTADFDFSFSGLKTAVLYLTQKIEKLTPTIKKEISREFENAVNEVLLTKTKKAIAKNKIKTLILGGGVTANKRIRQTFENLGEENKEIKVLIPEIQQSTDNAVMIGIASYFRFLKNKIVAPNKVAKIKAEGNLALKNF